MSQENVEIVRRSLDAWNRGDLDGWLAGFASEAELHTTGRFPDERVYRGRTGLERYWSEIHEAAAEINISISDLRASGDRVLQADGQGAGQVEQGAGTAANLGRYHISRRTGGARRELRDRGRGSRSRRAVGVAVANFATRS
jgi:ketosteroid isomerase-like protein